ncbi:MAG TPA: hypothetical protein DCP03_05660 [Polaromonas sp.]|nr:hypothetical protein [Polaromonas sp.]
MKSVGAIERSAGPPQASSAPSGGSALHEVKSVGAISLACKIPPCSFIRKSTPSRFSLARSPFTGTA